MFRRSHAVMPRSTTHLAKRLAQSFSKRNLLCAARVMAPASWVALSGVAHGQGTMDFSGAQTLMGTFNNRLAYVSISRASDDARIYTNKADSLGERLASQVTKTAALAPVRHPPHKATPQSTALYSRDPATRQIEVNSPGLGL
jgi:hypothetical protein